MEEIWKPIPNYEKYEVSNLGKVRSSKYKTVLKPWISSYGYNIVKLYKNNK